MVMESLKNGCEAFAFGTERVPWPRSCFAKRLAGARGTRIVPRHLYRTRVDAGRQEGNWESRANFVSRSAGEGAPWGQFFSPGFGGYYTVDGKHVIQANLRRPLWWSDSVTNGRVVWQVGHTRFPQHTGARPAASGLPCPRHIYGFSNDQETLNSSFVGSLLPGQTFDRSRSRSCTSRSSRCSRCTTRPSRGPTNSSSMCRAPTSARRPRSMTTAR